MKLPFKWQQITEQNRAYMTNLAIRNTLKKVLSRKNNGFLFPPPNITFKYTYYFYHSLRSDMC